MADSAPDGDYDPAWLFDCWRDLGHPLAATTRIREAPAADGTQLLVEAVAGDELSENLHPIGRLCDAVLAVAGIPGPPAQDRATATPWSSARAWPGSPWPRR